MTYLEITLPCPAAPSSQVRKERGGRRYFDLRGEHWYSVLDLRRETHLRELGLSPSHAYGPLQGLCSTHLTLLSLCLRNAAVRMQQPPRPLRRRFKTAHLIRHCTAVLGFPYRYPTRSQITACFPLPHGH
ncbi:hypothetical protein MHYP_G00233450 [Metynnis hypsauchen]